MKTCRAKKQIHLVQLALEKSSIRNEPCAKFVDSTFLPEPVYDTNKVSSAGNQDCSAEMKNLSLSCGAKNIMSVSLDQKITVGDKSADDLKSPKSEPTRKKPVLSPDGEDLMQQSQILQFE